MGEVSIAMITQGFSSSSQGLFVRSLWGRDVHIFYWTEWKGNMILACNLNQLYVLKKQQNLTLNVLSNITILVVSYVIIVINSHNICQSSFSPQPQPFWKRRCKRRPKLAPSSCCTFRDKLQNGMPPSFRKLLGKFIPFNWKNMGNGEIIHLIYTYNPI